MKEILRFELKKLINRRKTIITCIVLAVLCIGSFILIQATIGDAKGAAEKLSQYEGAMDDNPIFVEAEQKHKEIYENYVAKNKKMSASVEQQWQSLEYPMWLLNCNEIRKTRLAEIGFHADSLIVGDTIFYAFFEEFMATYCPFILGFLIVLLISPIFAQEYDQKMYGLVLSTKHGKKRIIIGKLLATIIIIILACVYTIILFGLIDFCMWGPGILDASFVLAGDNVFIYLFAPYNFRVWMYLLVQFGCLLLGSLGLGFFIFYVSSKCRNSLLTALISLTILCVPIMLFNLLGENEGLIPNVLRCSYSLIMGGRHLFSGYYPLYEASTITMPVVSFVLLCIGSILFVYGGFRNFRVFYKE